MNYFSIYEQLYILELRFDKVITNSKQNISAHENLNNPGITATDPEAMG